MTIICMNNFNDCQTFDDYLIQKNDSWNFLGTAPTISIGNGYRGGNCLSFPSGAKMQKTDTHHSIAFYAIFDNPIVDHILYSGDDGTATNDYDNFYVTVKADGSVQVTNMTLSQVTTQAFPAGTIQQGVWFYFCASVYVHDSGYVRLNVNGSTYSRSADMRISDGTNTLHGIDGLRIDHLVSDDNTTHYTLKPQIVVDMLPAADMASQGWVPSSGGSGFEDINDPYPDGDATYIESVDISNVSEFSLTALPSEITKITAVQVAGFARNSSPDGSGNNQVRFHLMSPLGVSASSHLPPINDVSYVSSRAGVATTNPDTGLEFTVGELNSSYIRIEME